MKKCKYFFCKPWKLVDEHLLKLVHNSFALNCKLIFCDAEHFIVHRIVVRF